MEVIFHGHSNNSEQNHLKPIFVLMSHLMTVLHGQHQHNYICYINIKTYNKFKIDQSAAALGNTCLNSEKIIYIRCLKKVHFPQFQAASVLNLGEFSKNKFSVVLNCIQN